jgi:hypothetical protein
MKSTQNISKSKPSKSTKGISSSDTSSNTHSSESIKSDKDIVLILGAGIHLSARMQGIRGREDAQSLASWSGIQ